MQKSQSCCWHRLIYCSTVDCFRCRSLRAAVGTGWFTVPLLIVSDADLSVLGVHTERKVSELALEGDYSGSRGVALMTHRLGWRSTWVLLMTLMNFVSGDRTLFQGDRTLFQGTELSFRGTLVQQTGVVVWHTVHMLCEVSFLVPWRALKIGGK